MAQDPFLPGRHPGFKVSVEPGAAHHSGLANRTPRAVAATWKDHDDQSTPAA
jgi:hypothetical protein